LSRTETQFGRDVLLTLDIELQKRIENHLADCEQNKNCQKPTAAVVMDVESGDILALVSDEFKEVSGLLSKESPQSLAAG